ncbi:MAG: Spi family protease inhibitor [Bacteroidota bacterium]
MALLQKYLLNKEQRWQKKNICRLHGQSGNSGQKALPVYSFSRIENSVPVYHVYKIPGKPSFVIVAADDRVTPILAYSFSSGFAADTMQQIPPVRDWLDYYSDQIQYVQQYNIQADSITKEKWAYYLNNELSLTDSPLSSVSPLTAAMWNQDCH